MEQGELLVRMLLEVAGLEPPLHIDPMPHHAGIGAWRVQENAVVSVRQPVFAERHQNILKHVRLNERNLDPGGAGKVFLESIDPCAWQVDRNKPSGLHQVGNLETFAAGGSAQVENALTWLRREQIDGGEGGGILKVEGSGLQQRFDFGPMAR